MSTVTLKEIVAKQAELAKMIEALQRATPLSYGIPEAVIEMNPGERYAGIVLDEAGEPGHHLILLRGEAEDISWEDAKKWAADQGGELPNRQEQAILYANLKSHFSPNWYWSSQAHETESSWAWCQTFGYGRQSGYHETNELRARAVRRIPINKGSAL